MNVLCASIKLGRKIGNLLSDLFFLCLQKPMLLMDNSNSIMIKGKLRNCRVMVQGKGNVIHIEKGVLLNKVIIEVSGSNNRVVLRKNVKMTEGGRIRIEDYNNIIEVQEDTALINAFLSSADINTIMKIGKKCLFSSDVIIRTSDAHSILNGEGKRINKGCNVTIGDHTWICNGTRVMKGTTIGSNCVIGSNTMIAGINTGDNVLVVGNPARVVKTDINWSNIRIIE